MKTITINLWFDNQAEEAANYYVSTFPDSRILNVSRYGDVGQEIHSQAPGSVMTVLFEIMGKPFMALNGGPVFTFSEAISFIIDAETQEEIDKLWGKLSAVPESEQCGWCKDKFGVSWQIVPPALVELMSDPNPAKSQAVMAAMLQMRKIDIAGLQTAYDQA